MDRRDFIRIVTSIFTSNTLLMTLTTQAQSSGLVLQSNEASITEGKDSVSQPGEKSAVPEKVEVSNNGKNLVLDISGKPGRWVVVLYKLSDKKGVEHTFIHAINRIKKGRVVSIAIDMGQSLDMDIPFMVVTSGSSDFNTNNFGTEWFSVRINSTQPITGNLPQNYATNPDGEHEKVVLYGIINAHKRSFAPLKRV